MSSNLRRADAQTFLASLNQSFTEVSTESNPKTRMENFVEIIETKKDEFESPKVVHAKEKKGCIAFLCNCIFRRICSDCTFCQQATCCSTKKVIITTFNNEDNALCFVEGKTDDENAHQLTNAAFVYDLYNTYGSQYLPIVYACSIRNIRTLFPSEAPFWENWDPKSNEPLEKSKVKFFREMMKDAYTVVHSLKLEMMRQDLQKNLEQMQKKQPPAQLSSNSTKKEEKHSPTGIKGGTQFKAIQASKDKDDEVLPAEDFQPPIKSPRFPKGSDMFDLDTTTSSSGSQKEVLVINYESVINKTDHKKMINDLLSLTYCSDEQAEDIAKTLEKKLKFPCTYQVFYEQMKEEIALIDVKIKVTIVQFERTKIITDVTLVTGCTEQQANNVANQVESDSLFPCTRQSIWDLVKAKVVEHGITPKNPVDIKPYESLLQYMEENGYTKVKDIPVEDLCKIMGGTPIAQTMKSFQRAAKTAATVGRAASIFKKKQGKPTILKPLKRPESEGGDKFYTPPTSPFKKGNITTNFSNMNLTERESDV